MMLTHSSRVGSSHRCGRSSHGSTALACQQAAPPHERVDETPGGNTIGLSFILSALLRAASCGPVQLCGLAGGDAHCISWHTAASLICMSPKAHDTVQGSKGAGKGFYRDALDAKLQHLLPPLFLLELQVAKGAGDSDHVAHTPVHDPAARRLHASPLRLHHWPLARHPAMQA